MEKKDFCFSTLALGKRYRKMAQKLGSELEKYSPNTMLFVGTDEPKDFASQKNIIAFKLIQQGILHCYHDKRFVVEKALSMFNTTIQIDADTNLIGDLPETINNDASVIGGVNENMMTHVKKFNPERVIHIEKVAAKLDLDVEKAKYIGESLMIFTRDKGKEQDFLNYWGEIGRYLELKGIHAGSGNAIGLAALKVGWKIEQTPDWEKIHQIASHFDASHHNKRTKWQQLKRRLAYHYRLNKTRLDALANFSFYYG